MNKTECPALKATPVEGAGPGILPQSGQVAIYSRLAGSEAEIRGGGATPEICGGKSVPVGISGAQVRVGDMGATPS